jgi:AcrR family transcriptional regulator
VTDPLAQREITSSNENIAHYANLSYGEAMTYAPATPGPAPLRRREQQKEQTRLDLALAAFDLAQAEGLANVRVPQIAEAVGVSTRTFNNYFPSKEAAIAWPARQRAARLAENLLARPPREALGEAIMATVLELYAKRDEHEFPGPWLQGFRRLIVREPALHGEYLKIADAAERGLGNAICSRTGASADELWPRVLAATVVGAERAAVRHWMTHRQNSGPLVETVRAALEQALKEVES